MCLSLSFDSSHSVSCRATFSKQNLFHLPSLRSWEMITLKLFLLHCLIRHVCDWRLQRSQPQLRTPCCWSGRWSQCDILWTRQTERWDVNICTRDLLTSNYPPPPPHCKTTLSSKNLPNRKESSWDAAPAHLSSRNEAWHRPRTETKQGSPVATGGWHRVFLITAKTSRGVPASHLSDTGAGGGLPQGSPPGSLGSYC